MRAGETLAGEMERDCMIDTINTLHRERDQAIDILKSALGETGCDGDLCNHRWHDDVRRLIADAHDTNEAIPRTTTPSPSGDSEKEARQAFEDIAHLARERVNVPASEVYALLERIDRRVNAALADLSARNRKFE